MNIIIGNIISLIATIIMAISGLIKDSKKFVIFQTTQILISVVANLFLLSPSGAISNLAGATRNILWYNKKLNKISKIILICITTLIIIVTNTNGLIGYLPIITTAAYTILMDKTNDKTLKILTIASMILWAIFDFSILNFVAGTFDVITIITCLISLKNFKKAIDKNQKTCYNINTD